MPSTPPPLQLPDRSAPPAARPHLPAHHGIPALLWSAMPDAGVVEAPQDLLSWLEGPPNREGSTCACRRTCA